LHDPETPYIPPMRPIRTKFQRVSFPSLNEARWACCWNVLGIPWVSQPQGFNLGHGVGYLCDFYLPTWDCYAEVKSDGAPLDVPIAKCRALARESKTMTLLIVGAPGGNTYYVNVYGRHGDESLEVEHGHFVECPRCNGFCILGDFGMVEVGPHPCQSTVAAPVHTPASAPRLFAAYYKAQNLDPRTSR
jgi:hypothetical protein